MCRPPTICNPCSLGACLIIISLFIAIYPIQNIVHLHESQEGFRHVTCNITNCTEVTLTCYETVCNPNDGGCSEIPYECSGIQATLSYLNYTTPYEDTRKSCGDEKTVGCWYKPGVIVTQLETLSSIDIILLILFSGGIFMGGSAIVINYTMIGRFSFRPRQEAVTQQGTATELVALGSSPLTGNQDVPE